MFAFLNDDLFHVELIIFWYFKILAAYDSFQFILSVLQIRVDYMDNLVIIFLNSP